MDGQVFRLFVFVTAAAIPSLVALWNASRHKSSRIKMALCAFVIFVTASYNAYYLYPPTFRADISLPLQVCDLLGFVAILALAADWRFARSVIVLCAIPFVSQAVLTPVGEQHMTSLRSLLYWAFHGCIFATFLFEVAVRKFKPDLRDFGQVCLLDFGYVGVISLINELFDWNYGYIGNAKPGVATMVDVLGPWPFRILNMTLLAIFMQFLCYLLFKQRRNQNEI